MLSLFLLCLLLYPQADAPLKPEKAAQPPSHASDAAAPKADTKAPVSVEEPPKQEAQPKQTPTQEKGAEAKPDYLWWGLITNLVIAIAAFVAAVFSIVQATAANKNAAAAKETADALKLSERAWVTVDLEPTVTPRFTLIGGDAPIERQQPYWSQVEHHGADLHIRVRNDGKTPAWITESLVRLEITQALPQEPDFIERELDKVDRVPRPLAVGGKHEDDVALKCPRKDVERNGIVWAYGFVKYRDAFGEGRETRFGYMIQVSPDESDWWWERVKNPNYNKQT